MKSPNKFAMTLLAAGLVGWIGCEKKTTPPTPTTTSAPNNGTTANSKAHDDDHAHGSAGHHGAVIELGSTQIGAFSVKASRDEGHIAAGGDAPIDVWLTPSAEAAKVVAVRFWIGTEKAAESVKAKAEIENPAEPNRWHTHAEVPNPIPAGSKLWVEIEIEGQGKQSGSFDLKM
jgi:hypothetical protein